MRPVIFYVDDEPYNLAVFEASLPENWIVYTYDNPMLALSEIELKNPSVILTDQRMPSVTGVQFLELAKKVKPDAMRIIVTGYSDENLIVESVRKAQVFDYIRKPWDTDDLISSIGRAIDHFNIADQAKKLEKVLREREALLIKQNVELNDLALKLETAHKNEIQMREELECWVPPFVLWTLKNNQVKFPMKKDIVGITFDIIDSSEIHGQTIEGQSLRSMVIQLFSEAIIRSGGWRESHSGDSAYGHFGLINDSMNPYEAALGAAREFRVAIRTLSKSRSITIECGIALHVAKNCHVNVHTVQLNTPRGIVTQKSFDSTSPDIDLLHRLEKIAHSLPGTNIIMSKQFVDNLIEHPSNLLEIGTFRLKGQKSETALLIIPSDKLTPENIKNIQAELIKKIAS